MMQRVVVAILATALCAGVGCPGGTSGGDDTNPPDLTGDGDGTGTGSNGGGDGIGAGTPPPGSPPTATHDTYTATQTRLTIAAASGVLANDFFTPPVTVSAFDALTPNSGGVTMQSNGAFTYIAPSGLNIGTDTFSYTITDTNGSSTATVTITLNIQTIPDPGDGGGGGGGGGGTPTNVAPGAYAGSVPASSFIDFTTDSAAGATQQTNVAEQRTFTVAGAPARGDGSPVQIGDVRQVTFGANTFTETVTGISTAATSVTVNFSVTMPIDPGTGLTTVSGVGQEFYRIDSPTSLSYEKLVILNDPGTIYVQFQWNGVLTR